MNPVYLKEESSSFLEIKKSRFITYLRACKDEESAREFYKEIRKKHPDATHHCTAMKIGSLMRSNDDGEPSGTAGRPMLDVLAAHPCDQIAAVVVRYFGGTLLGKGGLVRAYSTSVSHALDEAEFYEKKTRGYWQLCAPYSLCGRAESILKSIDADIVSRDYLDQAVFCFLSDTDPNPALAGQSGGELAAVLLKTVESAL
jgi:uncharacterized YigZ family protein